MEKKVEGIKESFNEIINDFISIIDYDELDVLKFLNKRKEEKYYKLIVKKNLLYLFYLIILMSQIFLFNILDRIIYFIVIIAIGFIGALLLRSADRIDKISIMKFKFTFGFYKKECRDLLDYKVQLHLLFGNQYLNEILKSNNIKSKYNKKLEQINKRIEIYTNAIKPITYKIKQYGIIGISISLLLSLFTNFIIQYILNPEIILTILYFGLLIPVLYLLIFGIIYHLFKKKKIAILNNYRAWLQLHKVLLNSKIKDLIILLHSIEFNNLEQGTNFILKELKSLFGKEIERLEKKIEHTKKRLKELKERTKIYKKEKKDEELKIIELEKNRLTDDLKNIREERKSKKKNLKI